MKKIFAGLTALAICGALNFGLMNDAQAAVLDSSTGLKGIELSEMALLPPPPPPAHHHQLPPNPYDDDWSHGHVPPPPPPPPPHRH
ncbi:MAG: hypothetical protein IKE46_04965 [Selenomonadaceae bacterium]|nr:hypothetical protein [Selenomonadaceae bacterium]